MSRRTLTALPIVALPVVLLVLSAGCRADGEPDRVRLRFEYREGDTLHYIYESKGTVTFPDTAATGGALTRTYERTMAIEEVAEEITPRGNYRLAVTYHLPPDTAAGRPAPEPITLHLEMTPQGKILSVAGVETAKPLFGDIDFQSYFEQAQPVFPDRALRVGDSWTQEVRVMAPNSRPVSTSSTYVLETLTVEDREPVATIAFDGEIYLPIGHSAAAVGSSTPSPQLIEERIRVQGRMFFVYERGVMARVETSARVNLTKLAVEGDTPARQNMYIQEKSSMRLTRP